MLTSVFLKVQVTALIASSLCKYYIVSATEGSYNMDLCIPSVRRLAKEYDVTTNISSLEIKTNHLIFRSTYSK